MSGRPLIAGFAPNAVLGVKEGRALRANVFLGAAHALGRRLPQGGCGLLLCQDRVAFALGFAAMLLRRSTALLPASHALRASERIVRMRMPSFALVDRADPASALQQIVVDAWTPTRPADEVPAIADEHVAAIVYTSGTTGDPQPHAKTWSSLVRGAAGLQERIGFRAGDAIVGAVPAQHMWGLEATIMLALQAGGILHAGVPLLPNDIAAALAQVPERRWLVLTPLHVQTCVQSGVALPSLTGTLTATSPLACGIAERFEQQTGAPTIEIYGSTETGVIGTRRPSLESAFTPLRGLSVEPRPEGLLLRGAQLDGDVPLRDHARVESDGRFTLTGRDADLVKVGGKRASLAMLDRQLLAIDGVADGAFVTLDAGGLTPRVAALAVAPSLDAARIMAALRERVDAVFLPRPLHLVDAMPRDALGKLPAENLRRRILELSAARSPSLLGRSPPDARPRVGYCRDSTSPSIPASGVPRRPLARPAQRDGAYEREFSVPATHPALPGHFPGRPIVPAAWLLTLVAAAASEGWGQAGASIRVDHARFRAPLAPDTPFSIRLERRGDARIVFACTAGSTRVADGSITLTEP